MIRAVLIFLVDQLLSIMDFILIKQGLFFVYIRMRTVSQPVKESYSAQDYEQSILTSRNIAPLLEKMIYPESD